MKYEIKYYEIMSDHILAIPEYSHKEIVEANSYKDVVKYVKSLKAPFNSKYKKADPKIKKMTGFDYTSSGGAVTIKRYKPPKVKKI